MATTTAGNMYIPVASEFKLSSKGVCTWVSNVLDQPSNHRQNFAYFSYKI